MEHLQKAKRIFRCTCKWFLDHLQQDWCPADAIGLGEWSKVGLSCWESAPLLFVCPLLLPTPHGSQGAGFHHGHCIKAAGALLPLGSPLVWRLGDSVGLFYSHPTDRLCNPKKPHGNLIWLHLMWFGSVCAGRKCWGHWQGGTEVNPTRR